MIGSIGLSQNIFRIPLIIKTNLYLSVHKILINKFNYWKGSDTGNKTRGEFFSRKFDQLNHYLRYTVR